MADEEEVSEDGEVIAENEGEYSTEKILLIHGEAYYMHSNGGARGAHDRQGGDGVWRDSPCDPTRKLTRSEAVSLMLDWGYEPKDVAEVTRNLT